MEFISSGRCIYISVPRRKFCVPVCRGTEYRPDIYFVYGHSHFDCQPGIIWPGRICYRTKNKRNRDPKSFGSLHNAVIDTGDKRFPLSGGNRFYFIHSFYLVGNEWLVAGFCISHKNKHMGVSPFRYNGRIDRTPDYQFQSIESLCCEPRSEIENPLRLKRNA